MKKKAISASEINRFAYCPYQWYYERIYGKKELLRLRRKRLDAIGVERTGNSRLKDGIRYHDTHYARIQQRERCYKILFTMSIIVIAIALFYFKIQPEFVVE